MSFKAAADQAERMERALANASGHADALGKGIGHAADETGRLSSVQAPGSIGGTGTTGGAAGAGIPGFFSNLPNGTDNLGNTIGAGAGQNAAPSSGAFGTAGSASKSEIPDGPVYDNGKGHARSGPAENCIGAYVGGVFYAGRGIPNGQGGLAAIIGIDPPYAGQDLLSVIKRGTSNHSSGAPGGAPGGGAQKTGFQGLTPGNGTPLPPGSVPGLPGSGTDPNLGSIAASSKATAQLLERLLVQATKNDGPDRLRALGLLN